MNIVPRVDWSSMPNKKKREATPRAPKVSPATVDAPLAPPEELATVWDDEIARLFSDLRPQQQEFLIAYLNTGNSAEAYRRVYNPLAKDHLASVAGSRLVASVGIEPILAKFNSYKTEALFSVVQGYREMSKATKPEWVQDKEGQWENVGDVPDWQARKEALLGIRKIHGLDQPAEVKHSGDVAMTHKYDIPNKRPIGQ